NSFAHGEIDRDVVTTQFFFKLITFFTRDDSANLVARLPHLAGNQLTHHPITNQRYSHLFPQKNNQQKEQSEKRASQGKEQVRKRGLPPLLRALRAVASPSS